MQQLKSPKGFTLVELLVVIAVIALLIGILLPTLNSARSQSKLAACSANLHSIGQLLQIYAQNNDDRLPRGPSHHNGNNYQSLLDPTIATSQLWTGYPFEGCFWTAPNERRVEAPPQYVGLGMLTKEAGVKGNEFFFCPADDFQNLSEEGPKIGQFGENAYSSYIYRQLDMLPLEVAGVSGIDCELVVPGPGRVGEQHFNYFDTIGSTPYNPAGHYNVPVKAVALDANSLGPTEETHTTNHRGLKVNVLYLNGAVNSFDNEMQYISPTDRIPWASIQKSAYDTFPNGVMAELDRIFTAADSPLPWQAPVPPFPVY